MIRPSLPFAALLLAGLAACAAGAPLRVAPSAPARSAQDVGSPAGVYGGLTFGSSHFGDYEGDADDDVDDDDASRALYVGYQLSPFFAVTTGFIDFGELHATGPGGTEFTDDIEYSGVPLLFHAVLPVHDRMAFFTSVGGLYWNQKVDFADQTGPFTADEDGASFAYGSGFNLYLNESETIGLHVQVARFIGVGDFDATGHDSDITFASVGVMFHTP